MSIKPTDDFKAMVVENSHESTRKLLDEALKIKVLLCLNDLNNADPMRYRRESMVRDQSLPHLTITSSDLREIASLQYVLTEPVFSSHRRFLGPCIVFYKKVMSRFLKKWLQVCFIKQFELNQRLLDLSISVNILENMISNLENPSRTESDYEHPPDFAKL